MERLDPINLTDPGDEADAVEAEHRYPCACQDPNCWADDRDPANVRLGTAWYAGDCPRLLEHPVLVGERQAQLKADEMRDDDFNRRRR